MLYSHWSFCWTSGCSSSSGWAKLWLSSHSCAFNFLFSLLNIRISPSSDRSACWSNIMKARKNSTKEFFFPKRGVRIYFSSTRSAKELWKQNAKLGLKSCCWKGKNKKHGLNSRGKRKRKHGKMQHGKGPGNFATFFLFPLLHHYPFRQTASSVY